MPDLIDRAVAWVKSPAYIDFTTRQLAILGVVLDEAEPIKVKDLAAVLKLSKPVVTRAVGVLVEHDFVARRRGDDRRDCFIAPTEVGRLFRSAIADSAGELVTQPDDEAPHFEFTDEGVMRALPTWVRDDEATFMRLMLEATNDVSIEQIAGWTDEQVQEADCWAWSVHLSAGDNDDIQVPPRPSFIAVVDRYAGRNSITGEPFA